MKCFNLSILVVFLVLFATPGNGMIQSVFPEANSVQQGIKEYIKQLEGSGTIKVDKQKIVRNPIITKLYKDAEYEPLWVRAGNRKDLLEVLEGAYFEGLNPRDYHINYIREHNRKLQQGVRVNMDDYAIADIMMTDAILTYAFHMVQGKVNPTKLDPNWNYSERPLPDDVEFRLMQRLQTGTLREGAAMVRPEIPLYGEFWEFITHLSSSPYV